MYCCTAVAVSPFKAHRGTRCCRHPPCPLRVPTLVCRDVTAIQSVSPVKMEFDQELVTVGEFCISNKITDGFDVCQHLALTLWTLGPIPPPRHSKRHHITAGVGLSGTCQHPNPQPLETNSSTLTPSGTANVITSLLGAGFARTLRRT